MMIGIDIGGTKIELAVFDEKLCIIGGWREFTPAGRYEDFLSTILGMVRRADVELGMAETIGVGVPGIVTPTRIVAASNIPALNGRDLLGDLRRNLERPIEITNDANAFVQSEAFDGAGAASRSVCGLVLGTGYSGAFTLDGTLNAGRQGIAGELGHIPISPVVLRTHELPLRTCGCGRVGCVEQYVSGPGLTWLCGFYGTPFRTVREFADGVARGSELAAKVLSVYLECLGSAIAQLVLVFDPEIFVLGGGLSNMDFIRERLPVAVAEHLFGGLTPPIIARARHGDSSGVRGAALIGKRSQPQAHRPG